MDVLVILSIPRCVFKNHVRSLLNILEDNLDGYWKWNYCKNAHFIVGNCVLLYPFRGTGSSLAFYLKKI